MTPEEFHIKLEKRLRTYSVSLMNNTKWRELFCRIAATGLWFKVSTIWNVESSILQKITQAHFEKEFIGDGCLVGGPLFYKEIFQLRVLRYQPESKINEKVEYDDARWQSFLASLDELGEIPLTIHRSEAVIQGYR